MYKVIILPAAKEDVRDATIWYHRQQRGLGKRFVNFVRRKVNKIALNPQLYVIKYSFVRTAIIDVFPYMIHFTINDKEKTLIVTAVLHMSQNPDL